MQKRIFNKTEQLYDFIKKYKNKNGFPPSVREMCSALNINSTSTITYYLNYLEEQGKIRRGAYKNRAIEILSPDKPDAQQSLEIVKNYSPIPVLGQITAGQPILATENYEDMFYMPSNLFKGSDLFILNVVGDSMINAGILNGDMVVIRKQDTAENGEIVAALIDDSATIKRFYKENGRYRLQPENPTMDPMYFDEVSIIGKVVGLIRNM